MVEILLVVTGGDVLHGFLRLIVGLFLAFLVLGTFASVTRSSAYWIRGFDFPRIQISISIAAMLVSFGLLHRISPVGPWEMGLVVLGVLSLTWQLYAILPYTRLHPKEVTASDAVENPGRVTLLVFNVLADNRDVLPLRALIREEDPDVVLLSEANEWWLDALAGLDDDYPHTLLRPMENCYGLLLYSRLELVDPEIRFLIEPEVPSIRARIRLRSGQLVNFFGLHPRPPGLRRPVEVARHDAPGDDADEDGETSGQREDSAMRDAELLLVAREVHELGDVPVIVGGDFNDVAWSHTTHRFQRIAGLLDPRVGRGLFNSFDTRSCLLRYPLDHIFASPHFLLVSLRRLRDIGSDHFPIIAVLDLSPAASDANERLEPKAGDADSAEAAIKKGTTRD